MANQFEEKRQFIVIYRASQGIIHTEVIDTWGQVPEQKAGEKADELAHDYSSNIDYTILNSACMTVSTGTYPPASGI